VHGLASTRVQDYGSVDPGTFSREIVAKDTSVLTQSFFGSCTGHDAKRSSHAHPEDSFPKRTSHFVQVKPIHNLVFFRYSCTCKMLTQTFLCLLRNTVSRSFTEMFLAIFQYVRPEDSYAKSTPPFVQVRPIHNLVRFCCSCTGKKLMKKCLCLLRDTISRSFTETFLAIFQSTVPEKDAQIYEQQTSQRVLHAKLQDPPIQCMARSPHATFVGIASRNKIYMTQRNNKEYY